MKVEWKNLREEIEKIASTGDIPWVRPCEGGDFEVTRISTAILLNRYYRYLREGKAAKAARQKEQAIKYGDLAHKLGVAPCPSEIFWRNEAEFQTALEQGFL